MTLTLELSEEELKWIEAQPNGVQHVRDMIRAQMDQEQRMASRYDPEVLELVKAAQEDAKRLKANGMTHEEAVDEFISLVSKVNSNPNGK